MHRAELCAGSFPSTPRVLLRVEVTSRMLPLGVWDPFDVVSFLCLQKVVEEEKQEHVDKVKELLGWAVGLKQSVQGRMAAAGSRELGDIEKSISEQQVKQGQESVCLTAAPLPQLN